MGIRATGSRPTTQTKMVLGFGIKGDHYRCFAVQVMKCVPGLDETMQAIDASEKLKITAGTLKFGRLRPGRRHSALRDLLGGHGNR